MSLPGSYYDPQQGRWIIQEISIEEVRRRWPDAIDTQLREFYRNLTEVDKRFLSTLKIGWRP